jgi:hypothetical protein
MSDTFPGKFVPASRQLEPVPTGDDEVSFCNDHGHRYLIGSNKDEHLTMWGDVPENRC